MKKLLLAFVGLTALLISIFVAIPNAVALLGFSGATFWQEPWRILTFSLAHVSLLHLLENIIALFIVALLAYELDMNIYEFLGVFLVSSVAVALITGAILPGLLVVGASLGIYSIFGALTRNENEYIKSRYIIGIFGIVIFLNILLNLIKGQEVIQPFYHAAGFFAGAIFITTKKMTTKRRRVLS